MPRRVLVVEDHQAFLTSVTTYLTGKGFEVLSATDGEDAIDLYGRHRPQVVVSDVRLPSVDGVTLLHRIRALDPRAVVIIMTGHGTEEVVLECLRGGAVDFLKKPFKLESLGRCVLQGMRLRENAGHPDLVTPHLVASRLQFSFPAGADTGPVVSQISLQAAGMVDDSELMKLQVGIEEIITNAIEHGCLGITADDKEQAIREHRFAELLKLRMQLPEVSRLRIEVLSELLDDAFQVTVTDPGGGFDWRGRAKVEPDYLATFSGRGILLARLAFDELDFNPRGNQVRLRKMRQLAVPVK